MASLDSTEIKRLEVHPGKCPRGKLTVMVKPTEKVWPACESRLAKLPER